MDRTTLQWLIGALAAGCAPEGPLGVADVEGGERGRIEADLGRLRALAFDPRPTFSLPEGFRADNGGFLALLPGTPPTVFAAFDGRVISGPLHPSMLLDETGSGCRIER